MVIPDELVSQVESLQAELRWIELHLNSVDPKTWPRYRNDHPPYWTTLKAKHICPLKGDTGRGTNAWFPLAEDDIERLKSYDRELRAEAFLIEEYPDLVVQVHLNPKHWSSAPSIHVWIRREGKKLVGGEWVPCPMDVESLGSIEHSEGGKIAGARKVLQGFQETAAAAKAPNMFYCTACCQIKPKEELEETVFAGRYCKACYQDSEEVRKWVDDSRKPGFYD